MSTNPKIFGYQMNVNDSKFNKTLRERFFWQYNTKEQDGLKR